MCDAVEASGGEVLKFIGDSVLAIFPIERDAAAACRRALEATHAAGIAIEAENLLRNASGAPQIDYGLRHARAAISSTTDDATALAIAAVMIAHLGRDYEAALSAIERALSFNASSAAALFFGAHIHAIRGNCARATEYASRALWLSPFDPWAFVAHFAFAIAAVKEARYDEAASHFARAVQLNSSFTSPRFLQAMTLALAGSMEEARRVVRGALELQPGFRTRSVFEIGLLPEFADKLAEGARLLGLFD